MTPLLSICIPTYNRVDFLRQVLDSIVSQDEFTQTDQIQIVISDNCSTDTTPELVKQYIAQYGSKIKYSKTEKNIGFDNFERVMANGDGKFLKLHNDYLLLKPNALSVMLYYIEKYCSEKPILFFRNIPHVPQAVHCETLDDFMKEISFFNTWIACFGMWKTTHDSQTDWFRANKSSLPQTDILCRMLAGGTSALIIYDEIFTLLPVAQKGGYNIAEVFGYNYLQILKKFVEKGALSKSVYRREKKEILLKHINPFYFDIKKEYAFYQTGYFKWLWNDYKYCPYFYIGYLKWMRKKFRAAWKSLFRRKHP